MASRVAWLAQLLHNVNEEDKPTINIAERVVVEEDEGELDSQDDNLPLETVGSVDLVGSTDQANGTQGAGETTLCTESIQEKGTDDFVKEEKEEEAVVVGDMTDLAQERGT